MTPLRQHMIAALHLSGKGERTQESSIRAVRLLAQFYHKAPDRIAEPERQRDFLPRKNVDGLAPASMRLGDSGIRFFSQHVLKRDWATLTLIRPQITHRLPAVRSVEEGKRLLASATPWHNPVSLTTVDSLGLRLQEALCFQVSDMDGQRRQVQVHRGKGAKDRYGPLPADPLTLLRTSWLLPATGREHQHRPTAASPMSRSSLQGAFRTAQYRAGITNTGVAIPTRRHASATPRLEAGVHPRLLQRDVGHTPRETTMLSLHRTHNGREEASERLNTRLHGLRP